jgi:putative ABC transport system permease protein
MNLWESIRVAISALRINMMRSVLTMLGIIIGVAAVITMVTVGAGAQSQIDAQISSLGTNLFMVMGGSGHMGGARMGAGSVVRLTEDDAAALKQEIPEIAAAAPTVRGGVQVIFGANNWATQVQGVDNDFLIVRDWDIVSGRDFQPREIRSGAKVVILGDTLARELFGESDPIGQNVRINKTPFEVIGVLEKKGQNMGGQDQDDFIMVPLDTARSRLLGRNRARARSVANIMVSVREAWMMDDVEERIGEVLRQRHKIPAGQEDSFMIRNLSEMIEMRADAARVFNMLLAAVASVSLLVGGIGIMNIMLVSVTERTREIGLRMAVGARPQDILKQFLVEAVTLCLVGGAIGIALAILATIAISRVAGWPVLIEWQVIVASVLFSGVIGVFFGYYPARKAASQNPIEALHFE